mmetsp:Transcript_115343/g.204407  ORF Transcript_115343/g.204407 Transcript_115343/m.204407 type:complete len:82 (+) Transcript_115343:1-246(+)
MMMITRHQPPASADAKAAHAAYACHSADALNSAEAQHAGTKEKHAEPQDLILPFLPCVLDRHVLNGGRPHQFHQQGKSDEP